MDSSAPNAPWTDPPWERAIAAIDDGDPAAAREAIDDAVRRWRSLQDYSVNWITSMLSFIGREIGEEAVERALRASGDDFVRERRGDADRWHGLPAEQRAEAIARQMVANFGSVDVSEDEEKITLEFRCGTGGRMIDEGRYGDDGYLTLAEAGPATFGRDELPVYCAHCSINNELQPIEWDGRPTTVEHPPTAPGEPCVHHIYRDPDAIPDEVYLRLGRTRPT
jgi:hypothetical protein